MRDRVLKVALVGQPNVGKSSLFTRLTGVGVISSNYPGTTVEFKESVITRQGTTVRVHDLPGTYGLSGNSADEKVVLEMLRDQDNDAVIVVADALNLESSIVLCFEVMEMGLPAILALNKTDSARKKFDIDVERLEVILGIEVIPVSAKTAEGVDALADAVCLGLSRRSDFKVRYDDHIEYYIRELSSFLPENHFDRRGRAVKILEGTEEFRGQIPEALEARVIRMVLRTWTRLTSGGIRSSLFIWEMSPRATSATAGSSWWMMWWRCASAPTISSPTMSVLPGPEKPCHPTMAWKKRNASTPWRAAIVPKTMKAAIRWRSSISNSSR